MRRAMLSLLAGLPMLAQAPASSFQVGVHGFPPTLGGRIEGIQDGQRVLLDLQDDLGLVKDRTRLGLDLEYQGPRFGVAFSMDGQDYKGSKRLTRTVTVDGKDYPAGTLVDSDLSVDVLGLNWTIRLLRNERAWAGVDLGIDRWSIDLTTTSTLFQAREKVTVPIPQIGLSGGLHILDERLILRGYLHYLSRSGANYHNLGLDARYFPLPWLGIRTYLQTERLDVPKGSIKDDLEVKLDRNGFGFGIVARF